VALLALAATGLAAQKQKPPRAAPPRAGAPSQPPAAPMPMPPLPVNLEQALYLIRSTLLTLNDANRSGNYTVMRDLSAPGFQAKNSAADLALIFTDLRGRSFDLFAVALTAPQLTAAPTLDGEGHLRITGVFPTRPQQIAFDLLFENAGGQWRLFGVSVATPPRRRRRRKPSPPNLPRRSQSNPARPGTRAPDDKRLTAASR
jgi:hypothetical protein